MLGRVGRYFGAESGKYHAELCKTVSFALVFLITRPKVELIRGLEDMCKMKRSRAITDGKRQV